MRRRHCHCALTRKICARASGDRPSVARKYSLRSMPEEKDSPAPVRTNTPQRSSVSIVSRTASISAASAGLIALRFSGLFIVTQATPVSYCTRTFLPPRSGVCLPPSDIFLLSPERVIALPRRPLIWDLRPEQDCILQDSPLSPLPGRVSSMLRFLCDSHRCFTPPLWQTSIDLPDAGSCGDRQAQAPRIVDVRRVWFLLQKHAKCKQ